MKFSRVLFVLFVSSLFIVGTIVPTTVKATTWYSLVDDTFTRANTSTGAAGSTTGVGNGWIDTAGGVWNIQSNTLNGFSTTSSDYLSKFLLRPVGDAVQDQREVVTIPMGTNFGQFVGVALRYQSGTNNYYLAHIGSTGVFLYKIVGGVTTLISSNTGLSLSNTNSYSVDFSAVGISPTALNVTVTNITGGNTVVSTIDATDSAASLQTTGRMGLTTWYNSGTTTTQISRIQAYSGAPVYNLGLSGATSLSTGTSIATPVVGLQVTGDYPTTTPVKLFSTSGTLAMSTTTGLTFNGASTGSVIYFSGSLTDINAALATLTYTRASAGTDTIEVSLVPQGEVFFTDNNHLYEYVSSTLTWTAAKSDAETRTKYGASGYLATIMSQAENDFVAARLSNAGWMGASDATVEGAWRWVTGPENGTQFWSGASGGATVGGNYANWNTGEPNDAGANEDCGQFLSGGSGKWNDLPCTGTTLPGYVVEYGAPGALPTVIARNVAVTTTSDSTPPTITSVTTTKADGSYKIGETIPVTINFSEVVTSTGSVTVTFETGTTDRTCTFSVSSATSGSCTYTVQAGDTTGDLSIQSISGTIRDAATNTMTNFVPATTFTTTSAISIDTTAPVLTVVSNPSGNVLQKDTTMYFTTNEICSILAEAPQATRGTVETHIGTITVGQNIAAYVSGIEVGGTYSVGFVCMDEAGNLSNTVSVGPFTLIRPGVSAPLIVAPQAIKSTEKDAVLGVTLLTKPTPTSPIATLGLNADTTTVKGYRVSLEKTFTNEPIISYTPTITISIPTTKKDPTIYLQYYSVSGQWSTVFAVPLSYSTSALRFTRYLQLGDENHDVKLLQQFLNNNGFIVSTSGRGSKGKEIAYFGQATKQALIKYQQSRGITPTGYFGPRTLEAANKAL